MPHSRLLARVNHRLEIEIVLHGHIFVSVASSQCGFGKDKTPRNDAATGVKVKEQHLCLAALMMLLFLRPPTSRLI